MVDVTWPSTDKKAAQANGKPSPATQETASARQETGQQQRANYAQTKASEIRPNKSERTTPKQKRPNYAQTKATDIQARSSGQPLRGNCCRLSGLPARSPSRGTLNVLSRAEDAASNHASHCGAGNGRAKKNPCTA